MISPPVPLPIPKWFRTQFVDKRTNRLSPRFFFRNSGAPRKPLEQALKLYGMPKGTKVAGSQIASEPVWDAWWAFTPFLVPLIVDPDNERHVLDIHEPWLAANTREPWFFFVKNIDQVCRDVIGFHSEIDAVLFRTFV